MPTDLKHKRHTNPKVRRRRALRARRRRSGNNPQKALLKRTNR